MTPPDDIEGDDSIESAAVPVRVWDGFVRAVHWLLVILLVAQVVTAWRGGSAAMEWHMRGGYAILALVLFRILWGFLGTHSARFRSFVRSPADALRYVRSHVRPPRERYAGHNPVGGWMVLLLLSLLLVQAILGLYSNDDVSSEGPWVNHVTKDLSDALTAWHRRLGWTVVALAGVHVAAVLYYVTVLKEGLVRAMVTGVKHLPPELAPPSPTIGPVRAAVLLAACIGVVWWAVTRL